MALHPLLLEIYDIRSWREVTPNGRNMTGSAAFLYETTEDGVSIFECRCLDTIAVVPEEIDGLTVTELAPYAFSGRRINFPDQDEGQPVRSVRMWTKENEESFAAAEDLPLLSGERLEEIILPASVRKIGNYAFYNCPNLKKITCHSTIEDLGSGMLTGCNGIRQVDITLHPDRKSCMKELLSEMRQRLTVWYHNTDGTARLIFPEFYEEAVENTPARILWTMTHGSGHRYRYCFVNTEFQFKEYDAVFGYAKAQETVRQLLELSFGRLFYPLHLSEEAREEYLQYVKENWNEAAEYMMDRKNLAELEQLMQLAKPDEHQTEDMIRVAGSSGYAEGSSYLLSYRQRHFKITRRQFVL